jgi:hypothetical protein
VSKYSMGGKLTPEATRTVPALLIAGGSFAAIASSLVRVPTDEVWPPLGAPPAGAASSGAAQPDAKAIPARVPTSARCRSCMVISIDVSYGATKVV